MSDRIENVSVGKKANVFFDGKCVSHSVYFPDGSRKTVGVIMPGSRLTFNVGAPELMEITAGECSVKIAGEPAFKTYAAGTSFKVAQNGSFEIHTGAEAANYVCSFG
ncbi:MAG: pyrimidine/purine nucleoside phosphorylase [Nitrosomonadales bacterium]|nr:pyrimidine/purine nucleoside phosphorylase [Nitrosomonadales bacterium]